MLPFHVPVVIVPTVDISDPTSFEAAIDPANIVLVTVPVSPLVITVPDVSGKVYVLLWPSVATSKIP